MKILYGVPSEGMGHATRSKVIISHLVKNHDVRIVSSDRSFLFMQKSFPGIVYEISGFHLAYKKGQIAKLKTVTTILKNGPRDLIRNFHRYLEMHADFRPDVVISDFESFSYLFAKHHRIPVISIDNMQVLNRCKLAIPIPAKERENFLIAKNIVKAKLPSCSTYLISSFFDAPVQKPNTFIIPPIIRESIIAAKTDRCSDHIVVYQTSASQNNLVEVLRAVTNRRFLVYGFNKEESIGNVILKKFSEEGFIEDLATADAVITNGGFSLISEAIYLGKPVSSVPIAGQFEQYANGAYVEQCGYGRFFSSFSADSIKAFLYDVPLYRKNLSAYLQKGNEETFKKVDMCMR